MELNDSDLKIIALATYYDIAHREYDRMISYFDQVDNKVNIILASLTVLPLVVLGLGIGIADDVGKVSLILWAISLIPFAWAMFHLFKAICVRDVDLGIPYDAFSKGCEQYSDEAMQEWSAEILLRAANTNYSVALTKATESQRVLLPALLFWGLLAAGIIYGMVEGFMSPSSPASLGQFQVCQGLGFWFVDSSVGIL